MDRISTLSGLLLGGDKSVKCPSVAEERMREFVSSVRFLAFLHPAVIEIDDCFAGDLHIPERCCNIKRDDTRLDIVLLCLRGSQSSQAEEERDQQKQIAHGFDDISWDIRGSLEATSGPAKNQRAE